MLFVIIRILHLHLLVWYLFTQQKVFEGLLTGVFYAPPFPYKILGRTC